MTPTEAFAALDAGATGLKMFPGELIGIKGVKARRFLRFCCLRIYLSMRWAALQHLILQTGLLRGPLALASAPPSTNRAMMRLLLRRERPRWSAPMMRFERNEEIEIDATV